MTKEYPKPRLSEILLLQLAGELAKELTQGTGTHITRSFEIGEVKVCMDVKMDFKNSD